MTQPFQLGHRPALDGLRGVAVLLVMGFHFEVPGLQAGFLGVDIFFVLSGFLITALLLEEWSTHGSIQIFRFYGRRALRLFPALWLLLIVIGPLESRSRILATLGYVANWAMIDAQPPWRYLTHVWSLAVEEQFYLFWPLTIILLLRVRAARLWLTVLPCCLVLLSLIERLIFSANEVSWQRMYYGLDTHGSNLLVGAILGVLVTGGKVTFRKWVTMGLSLFGALVIISMLLSARMADRSLALGFSTFAFAVAIVIYRLTGAPAPLLTRLLSFQPLVAVGKISYGLYLWQWPVHQVFTAFGLPARSAIYILLRIGATFLAASLSYWLVERPALRLKPRLERREEPPPPHL